MSAAASSRRRVLVVDDDPLIRTLVSAVLEDARFELDVASDGAEALAMVAERPPDVVVLDLMMPGVDGYAVCRAIRANPKTAGARIVVLTAKSDAAGRDEAMRAGADAYFTKPFSPIQLIDAITARDGAA